MRQLKLLPFLLSSVLAGCASLGTRRALDVLPLLSPASFGVEASVLQRLIVRRESTGDALVLDAALEIDARELRVAGFLLGQRILLVTWDGSRLLDVRESVVPKALGGEAILRDLQLVYWPADAIRAALPKGWHLEEETAKRRLYHGATVVFESVRTDALQLGSASLWNHVGQYRINIESSL